MGLTSFLLHSFKIVLQDSGHVLELFSLSLTKSVQLERMFLMFMDIFQYVEQMARIAKHLRISHRFVVLTIGIHGAT